MARKRLFYGWVVVLAVFVATFIGFGIAFSFAAFFPALRQEFGAARGAVSLLFSLSGFLYFGIGALTGPLADRFGPRRIAVAGMVLLGLGLALASQAETIWQAYVAYGLGVGLGVGFIYVPAIGAVQRWFIDQRGLATGLAVAGIGAGTFVVPLAAAELIEATSWRHAYLLLALLAITVGLGAALFLEHSPKSLGLLPDGKTAGSIDEASAALIVADGPTLRSALASRPFWLIYLASFLGGLGLYIPTAHLAAYAQDHGLSERAGLLLLGLVGLGNILGRFTMGGLADHLGRGRSLTLTYAGMAFVMFAWLASTSQWALAAVAILFGLGWGGYVALFPAISADYFGGKHGTGIFGLLLTNLAFGTLIGPSLAGFAFDVTGSYTLPIVGSAVANLIAVGCMLLIERPDTWRAKAVLSPGCIGNSPASAGRDE